MPHSKRLLRFAAAASAVLMVAIALLAAAVVYRARSGASPAGVASDAPVGALPRCTVERSGPVAFSGLARGDVLHVSIEGDPCWQGALHLRVEADDGAVLYRYDAPFKPHVARPWNDPRLDDAAADFAEQVLANASIAGTTAELPPWADAAVYYGEHHDGIQVDRAGYEALRRVQQPILWHATGAETWRSVVYDPVAHEARVILAGGS